MPSETDRPIEKQLREQAARRLGAAGKGAFSLHPVTRNALQVEVEREFGKAARNGNQQTGWLAWWPKFALAGGALTLVAALGLILLRPGKEREVGQLAMKEKANMSTVNDAAAAPKLASKTLAEARAPAPASPVSPASASVPVAAAEATQQEFRFTVRSQQLAGKTLTPAPVRVETPKATSEKRATTKPKVVPAAIPPTAPLQGAFQVSITDDQITLVDADRSRYSGTLEPVRPAGGAPKPGDRVLSFKDRYYTFTQGSQRQQVPIDAQFVAVGTNLTTRAVVRVTGQMTTQTQAVPARVSPDASARREMQSGVYLQIRGTANLGGRQNFAVDATTQP